MSVASERRAARGCHASSEKSLIGLDVPEAELQTGEILVDESVLGRSGHEGGSVRMIAVSEPLAGRGDCVSTDDISRSV